MTKADARVQLALQAHFGLPCVCFKPIQQPTNDLDGYWHVRMKDMAGVVFVRQNGIGELLMHGPTRATILHDAE
jgi:hypothetical protein